VLEVGVKDNGAVRKGQVLFRIDPEPYELAVQSAEANLSVALQGADVSVADVASARAQLRKQSVDLSANRKLGRIGSDLVKNALAETNEIRPMPRSARPQRSFASPGGPRKGQGQSRRARL
jgi:membrane fusion protein (multidrug efflux system)